jgi:hypothetical protein
MVDFTTHLFYGVKIENLTLDEIVKVIADYFNKNCWSYALSDCIQSMTVDEPTEDDIRDWLFEQEYILATDDDIFYFGESFYRVSDGEGCFDIDFEDIIYSNISTTVEELLQECFNHYERKIYLIRISS